jgi:hypothetical protein
VSERSNTPHRYPFLAATLRSATRTARLSYLAALATGNADRWQAGVSLIQAGSPERAAALSAASRLVNGNSEALQACSDAAKKAGKEQKCTISVQALGP